MDQQYPTVAKIPVLDTRKFEQWQFLIQQYLQHEHYALWKVIEFEDSNVVPESSPSTTTIDTTSGETGTKSGRTVKLTAEDIQRKKNDATKKTKMNLLKQQYGSFKAEGSETLEQTFTRLQVIVGQLEFMDVQIEQDDLNQKFLTSLAPEWLMHTIVWRNRSDIDTMILDDLYNHLKVYESEIQKKLEPNSQNIGFISSAKHSSGNEDGNTACVSTASTNVPTASASVATISQDTTCAYIASQSSGSQIKFEVINQIDEDDMEEMDIKWNMALLSMRADKAPRSQDRGRRDNYRQGSKGEEQDPKSLMAIDGVGWDWSYMENDEEDHALVADEVAPIEFALMANTSAESKVIEFGDSYKAPQEEAASESSVKKKGRTFVITTEDMQKWKNDVKARTTLLFALPNEHQLRFNKECRAPRSKDKGRRESYRQGSKEEEPAPKALIAINGIRWDWSYMANEEENHALVADDEAPTEFALMVKSSSSSENK
nr:hypothetical protein [Tanacetum cinerariifolium]